MRPLSAVPPPTDEPVLQLCAFFIGDEEYAIDIMRVDEILQPQKATPVPGAPPFVLGVINLRGSILPVVDLAKCLGAPVREPRQGADLEKHSERRSGGPASRDRSRLRKPKLIVCWLGRRRIALSVDGMAGVVREKGSDVKPPPPVVVAGRRPCIVGVTGGAERLRLLLDLRAALDGGRSEESG